MAKKQDVKYINSYMNEITVTTVKAVVQEKEVKGVKVQYFAHKLYKYWDIFELTTGMSILPTMEICTTRKQAEDKIQELFSRLKVSFKEVIDACIKSQLEQGIRDENGLIEGKFERVFDEKTQLYIDKYKLVDKHVSPC